MEKEKIKNKYMREYKKEQLAEMLTDAIMELTDVRLLNGKKKEKIVELEESLSFIQDQNTARKTEVDRLQRHLKVWAERAKRQTEKLMTLQKGVMIHTDGTVAGSTVWIDGQQPHDLTTAKVKINIRYGVQASLETYKHGRFKRHWIYGEDYYPEDFAPAPFRPEDGEGVAPQRWIPKEIVTDRDNVQEDFSHPDHPDLWECGSCWSVNPLREEDQNRRELQCPVCRQWTPRKKAVKS